MSNASPLAKRIGFLGAGQMATALAKGFLEAGIITTDSLIASDLFETARERFSEITGSQTSDDNEQVVANSDVLILAVKPQNVIEVLTPLKGKVTEDHLVISIAAGVTLNTYAELLGNEIRLVRVMPNTPCQIGAGACGFALGGTANSEDAKLTEQLLQTVGLAVQVPEKSLDAVTGLSGSGPAYVFEMIEALSDGGVLMGLPRQTATQLAAQTLLGAAKMVLETGQHPGQLKDAVTSPGGTTITGLHALEQGQLRATLMNAVQAATERSAELS